MGCSCMCSSQEALCFSCKLLRVMRVQSRSASPAGEEDAPNQAMDVERLLSAGALHRESQEAPVPPALQTLPKRFQLQARLAP